MGLAGGPLNHSVSSQTDSKWDQGSKCYVRASNKTTASRSYAHDVSPPSYLHIRMYVVLLFGSLIQNIKKNLMLF